MKKKIKRGEILQPYEPEMHKPGSQLITTTKEEDILMQDENKTQFLLKPEEREARLEELTRLLAYLEVHAAAKLCFDQNGSRKVYAKFKESESNERDMHMLCTYFIASHLPSIVSPVKQEPTTLKTVLKKKEYDIKISEEQP